MNKTLPEEPLGESKQPASNSTTNCKAWLAKSPKQPMVLETVDLGPLGAEDVEAAVEHCGLCHSDLSVLNNEWGISQFPATLGHEVIGRNTAVGPNVKGLKVGQRVGVGWNSGSCMHCHQCMSGSHHLCARTHPGRSLLAHHGTAQRFGFADGLAGGDRDDARLCFSPQCPPADRAFPDEQNQRSLRPA